jgi:hypothetical protein
MNEKPTVDDLMIGSAQTLQREAQEYVEQSGGYVTRVTKGQWPKEMGYSMPLEPTALADSFANARSVHLKHAAINSPDICLDDKYLYLDLRNHLAVVKENLKWMWGQTFQNEIIRACRNRSVMRPGIIRIPPPGTTFIKVEFPRKISFFGKAVMPFLPGDRQRWVANPKYKRASTQFVGFHPDIVHFLFPDLDKWAADISWRNIPDRECNPNGQIGFYRALMRYAAKPMQPELGWVITMLPGGFRGWLQYWAWKIVGFNP